MKEGRTYMVVFDDANGVPPAAWTPEIWRLNAFVELSDDLVSDWSWWLEMTCVWPAEQDELLVVDPNSVVFEIEDPE